MKKRTFLTGLAALFGTAAQAQFGTSGNHVSSPAATFHPAPMRPAPSLRPPITQHVSVPMSGQTDIVRSTGGLPARSAGGFAPYRSVGSFGPSAPRPGMAAAHGPYAPQGAGHKADGSALARPSFVGTRSPYMPGSRPVFSQRQFAYHGQSFAAVHVPAYRFVRDYGYRPFAVGMRFPAFLLLTDYFLTDYYLYNLAPPPGPGLMWVRFGPDALLVNTYTGDVADTAAGLFDDSPPPPSAPEGDEQPSGDAPPEAAPNSGYPGPEGLPMPPQ